MLKALVHARCTPPPPPPHPKTKKKAPLKHIIKRVFFFFFVSLLNDDLWFFFCLLVLVQYTMGRGIVHACHAGGVVHFLEGWEHHEVGAINVDQIDVVWEAALRHGLKLV